MTSMDTSAVRQLRREKDEFFRNSFDSPLDHDAKSNFRGLKYFEPNPDLVFTVSMEPGDGEEIVIRTSDDRERRYRRAGHVALQTAEQEVKLTLFDTGHPGYFVPFRDATSGNQTYGAGRYLEFEANEDGTVTIDFNMAYNPYCVYSDGYSCPVPPVENWLSVPIEAGEMNFPKD
jgi:uncharacterized protein (DUF1684 family)